jgi:DNA repair exonuclease SbcCD ATPase subunit
VRKDVEWLLGGFQTKSRVMESLRQKIQEHRRDDLAQLAAASVEADQRWEERLSRLPEWTASAQALSRESSRLLSWRNTVQWFDRAHAIGRQLAGTLERNIGNMEKRLGRLEGRLQEWQRRLSHKETELREMANRQADPTADLPVSAAHKGACLDFVFLEREEEGRISMEFKKMSSGVRWALHRLSLPEDWMARKTTDFPAYFEIRKNQISEPWHPLQQKLDELSEATLHLGLAFEEGRKRLRGIYEIVQKMKSVAPAFTPPRPLLHRLLNLQDD